jgi:hypothetical protein
MKLPPSQAIVCGVMLLGLSGCTQQASGAGSGGMNPEQPGDAGTPAVPSADLAAGDKDILVPLHGALLGHFYGAGTLAETDARLGRKPAIHLAYYDWATDWTTDPTTVSDFADGRIPLINWEPANVNFDDIISGKLDSTIMARANGAKALGGKFFLDFAAEMNGDEGWGGNNPTRYIAAYRHIHDIFVTAGATNVVWAWCPNVTDVPGGAATMDYYPGDTYVDWTGVDGYNWGTSVAGFSWQSFHEVFADIYPKLAAKGKPIIIGEMASDEVGGSKAQWIDGIIPALENDFPLTRAFVWFDIDKERHWQINSSPAALAAYVRLAKDPFMNP